MASVIPIRYRDSDARGSWIDDALYVVAAYAVPVLIALATLCFLPRQYESRGALPLAMRVIANRSDSLHPAEALGHVKPVSSYSMRLSEKPVWFSFTSPVMSTQSQTVVEFPSRHAQTLAWNASTMQPLGQADRESVSGEIRPVKAGFFHARKQAHRAAFRVVPRHLFEFGADQRFLVGLAGTAQLGARLPGKLGTDRGRGLLTLAVFVFVTALINHKWTYVIFAVWLVGNLRLCANAMGWDMQWLGRLLPSEYLPILRQVTFAAYYLLTAALTLPYAMFIPTLWVIAGFGIFVLLFFLTRLVWMMARSRTVMWYVGSLAVVQDALSHADRACREAKKVANTHLVTYRKGAAAFEERAEELRLVGTLGRNRLPPGLFLVMQPIMSMASPTESLNFEVLLRMRAPDGTTLLAGKMIVAEEESGISRPSTGGSSRRCSNGSRRIGIS